MRARAGETVLIPGSMGTASYVAEGLGTPRPRDLPARCRLSGEPDGGLQVKDFARGLREMAALGVALLRGDPGTFAEEAAFGYKDIETVMAASASLVRPVRRLTLLGVVKGSHKAVPTGPPGRRPIAVPPPEQGRLRVAAWLTPHSVGLCEETNQDQQCCEACQDPRHKPRDR